MDWVQLKSALLYGTPPITHDMLQPQSVKTAVREIARLVRFGWVEEPTEELLQRIRLACDQGQCQDILEDLQSEDHPLLKVKKRRASRRRSKSRPRAASKQ
jgi:hypothetical protein